MRGTRTVQTPTGGLAVIAATAAKLLEEGIITGSLDGELKATDAAVVKAAIMRYAVCDFCSTPGASHYYDVPDFGVTFGPARDSNYSVTKSTGGWMACDPCDAMIQKNDRAGLVERAVETMAFPKFTRGAIAEFIAKFWQGMDEKADAAGIAAACVDFVEDRQPKLPDVIAGMLKSDRIEAVTRATGLERRQVVAMLDGKLDHSAISKLVSFKRSVGGDDRRMAALIAGHERPPLPDVTPHWQKAIDMKFTATLMLTKAAASLEDAGTFVSQHPTDLNDPASVRKAIDLAKAASMMESMQFRNDLKLLQRAETYSFGVDPIAAITEAAKLVPADAPLSSVEAPTGAGWFWFPTPLPIAMTTNMPNNFTNALLWGWVEGQTEPDTKRGPAMRFSGVTLDVDGLPALTALWYWPARLTLTEMLAFNRGLYDEHYGQGGVFSQRAPASTRLAVEQTLAALEAASRFFLAACVWFKQKILVSSPGHIERHARKRIMREHKQTEQPSVRVIALRASLREQVAKETTDGQAPGSRKLHVRFVVTGHPRLQRCGPSRADVKLIWISPYPKGPEGAPFKERQKVFAVIR